MVRFSGRDAASEVGANVLKKVLMRAISSASNSQIRYHDQPLHLQPQFRQSFNLAEDYKGAVKALNNALDRGAEEEGKIYFSLMEAHFYQENFKQAWKYNQMAKKESSMRRNAVAWEPYIKEKAKNRGIDI